MNPGPTRQRLKLFPTPKVADLIYTETFDATRRTFPAYGSAHPDTTNYPDHVLVHITQADEQGLVFHYHYAADRTANQEDYNYTLTYPYGGDPRYPRITRTYILRRGQDPLTLGSLDPGTTLVTEDAYLQPSPSTDTYLQPSPSTDTYLQPYTGISTAVLVAQSERRLGPELDSVYVEITRVYDVLPGSDDSVSGSGASQTDAGYRIERPLGTSTFLRLTWTLTLPRTVADNAIQANYTACPIPGFEALLLVNERIVASDEHNQTSEVTRVYEGNAIGPAFPSSEKVRYQGKFYPGNLPPEKFVVSWRRMVDTYEIDSPDNQNVSTPSTPPVSTALPKYGALMSVEAKPSDVLRGKKEVEYYTDIVLTTLHGQRWDDSLRDNVPNMSYVIPTEDAVELMATDPDAGTERSVTPLGTGWSLVVIQAPVERSISVVANPYVVTEEEGSQRSYHDNTVNYWPPVLKWFEFYTTAAGTIGFDYDLDEGFNGPCKALFQVGWSKSAPTYATFTQHQVEYLQTTGLRISWPGIFSISIPECLHRNPVENPPYPAGSYVFSGTSGGVPRVKVWLPTTYGEWPDYYVKAFNVQPYLGGYRMEKLTVFKPEQT